MLKNVNPTLKNLNDCPKPFSSWFLAVRPKTLIAGIIPVLVGSFMPALPFAEVDWNVLVAALLVSILMTIGVNLVNDALDCKKGADTAQRIGPVRVTQSGLLSEQQVLGAAFFVLSLSLLAGFPLILKGGSPLLAFIVLSILFSYLYTGGPYPLSYHGLGEIFVILFYGFGAVLATYYLQAGTLTLDAFVGSLQMGLLATVMISINNLRDIVEDTQTEKKTLAVRFGIHFAKWEITILIVLPFLLNFYWYFAHDFLPFFLPSSALLIAVNLMRGIWKHEPSKLYNRFLGEASLLLALFGLLLTLGINAHY